MNLFHRRDMNVEANKEEKLFKDKTRYQIGYGDSFKMRESFIVEDDEKLIVKGSNPFQSGTGMEMDVDLKPADGEKKPLRWPKKKVMTLPF